jgi:hypothetical protein
MLCLYISLGSVVLGFGIGFWGSNDGFQVSSASAGRENCFIVSGGILTEYALDLHI